MMDGRAERRVFGALAASDRPSDAPLMLVRIGHGLNSVQTGLETIDDLQRGCSGVRQVQDGRVDLVALIYRGDNGYVSRPQRRVAASIYSHRRRGRIWP